MPPVKERLLVRGPIPLHPSLKGGLDVPTAAAICTSLLQGHMGPEHAGKGGRIGGILQLRRRQRASVAALCWRIDRNELQVSRRVLRHRHSAAPHPASGDHLCHTHLLPAHPDIFFGRDGQRIALGQRLPATAGSCSSRRRCCAPICYRTKGHIVHHGSCSICNAIFGLVAKATSSGICG